jgi:uridine phosphorylase
MLAGVSIHLRPSAPVAADALLPGDPGRALALAQELLTDARMSNHHRGLWGYYGETPGGHPLTIQSTGMGGPSAAIVLEELAELGVRRAVRVGTCGALDRALELGEVLRVEAALATDGVSRRLGAAKLARPDERLLERLATAGESRPVTVATTDLFYEPEMDVPRRWAGAGAAAVEMEAAPLFVVGARLGVAVGCLLCVSDVFPGGRRQRIADQDLRLAAGRMGRIATAALAGRRADSAVGSSTPSRG